MPFIDPDELTPKEPRPGFRGRFFHSEHMTFTYYDIEPGCSVHRHRHPNEEVWHIVEGEVEMSLADGQRVVRAGQAVVVPADVEHSLRTLRRSRAIVVDYPLRDVVGGIHIR